ncbi:cyclophilin-like fold protein [Chitinophaga japonensis]
MLNDNATVNAFKAMQPMTINMSEMNGNEKLLVL